MAKRLFVESKDNAKNPHLRKIRGRVNESLLEEGVQNDGPRLFLTLDSEGHEVRLKDRLDGNPNLFAYQGSAHVSAGEIVEMNFFEASYSTRGCETRYGLANKVVTIAVVDDKNPQRASRTYTLQGYMEGKDRH